MALWVLEGLEAAVEAGHMTPKRHRCMLKDLTIVWSKRMRSALGRARTFRNGPDSWDYNGHCEIAFAVWGFDALTQEERRDLATHEAAHLVEAWTYGAFSHSARWKRIHRAMGGAGERLYEGTARPTPPRRQNRRYQFTCGCGRVYTRTRRGLARYFRPGVFCRDCREEYALANPALHEELGL